MKIQSNSKMGIQIPVNNSGRQQKTKGTENFQFNINTQTPDIEYADNTSSVKNEILSKFPALTEEKLEQLIKDYDIESMDSEELFNLAGKLMEDNVIPSCPQENGLNLLFTFPKELYDSFLKGEASMPSGIARVDSNFFYFEDSFTGEAEFCYPRYGLKRLEYENKICQEAFKRFENYYTGDELERQIQLTNSKARFLEIASLLVAYKEDSNHSFKA